MSKQISRPSGAPAPTTATLVDGTALVLEPLAIEIARRYAVSYPDEADRYSPEWRDWCIHDNQHILRWALDAQQGLVDLSREISWLARILEARGFPLDRLSRNLVHAADVLVEHVGSAGHESASALRATADRVKTTGSFL